MRILVSALLLLSELAVAGPVLEKGASAYFLNTDRTSIASQVLGSSCNLIRNNTTELACNPALLGESAPGTFGGSLVIGRDYEKIYKNRELISGDDKLALAKSVLTEIEPVHFEASSYVWWRGEKLALAYQPLRATYFSSVRNQAYPDVAVHAMQEESLVFQGGGFLNNNLRAGVTVKGIKRKFVQEEFNLFDAIPNINEHLKLRDQDLVLVEPGIAYEFHGDEDLENFRPLLSAKISNFGARNNSFEDVPEKPVLDAGFSIAPKLVLGEVELALNYRYNSEIASERKFRVGLNYQIEKTQWLLGWDPDQWAAGFTFKIYAIGLGFMFQQNRFEDFVGTTDYENSEYLELRFAF